jgi:hypothetical protein
MPPHQSQRSAAQMGDDPQDPSTTHAGRLSKAYVSSRPDHIPALGERRPDRERLKRLRVSHVAIGHSDELYAPASTMHGLLKARQMPDSPPTGWHKNRPEGAKRRGYVHPGRQRSCRLESSWGGRRARRRRRQGPAAPMGRPLRAGLDLGSTVTSSAARIVPTAHFGRRKLVMAGSIASSAG